MPKNALKLSVALVVLIASHGFANAVQLPNGNCSAGGMAVTVSGGKITSYKFQGTPYDVRRLNPAMYKIGQSGMLTVRSPKAKSFRGTFTLNGRNTNATFNCQ